jgi:hypothetical protein
VHAELNAESANERRLGLPARAHKLATAPAVQAALDVGFMDSVVRPLWGGLANLLPGLAPCLVALAANRSRYAAIAGGEEGIAANCSTSGGSASGSASGSED